VLDPPHDKVRELQRALYRAAKADPERRFHALYDKVYRRDVLQRAWAQVRANRGAAGIDETTIADVEQHGVDRLLDELAAELKGGSYRPLPARRVFIPKPCSSERRPLSIPAVRDRVVQAAVKLVIEPIFEADMLPCSLGFRPNKTAHDALQVLHDESWNNRRWVVETDIASCFETIPHSGLLSAVEERICDRHVLKLLRAMLRAGVMQDGAVAHAVTGAPQGGVASPLLANIYLHRLDRRWRTEGRGVLIRYADDVVVMCGTRVEAERALFLLTAFLADLGLAPKAAKTRIVHLRENGEGLDFLGFHLRMVRAMPPYQHVVFLARWPSRKAMQHARDRIRFLTARARLAAPPEQVVAEVNRFLRGWAGYFRYGNSAEHFDRMRTFAVQRLARYVGYRHQGRRFKHGWYQVVHASPDQLGLLSLNGIVVAPRANKPWREKPNATRRTTSVSRVRENRMHGSTGRGWKRTRPTTAEPR
jgi:RNA-directed DNA polymerase